MSPSTISRRSFLKRSTGLAAAAIAAPHAASRSWAGAEAPSEKLIAAAIGVGGRGSGIGHQAGGQGLMVACADVHRQNAENFAKRYGGKCEVHGDYRKILDRKDVDVITCGTPDHWHTKVSIDAMEAGKDLYCEKPLTLTMAEGKKIMEVTKRTGRVFQVGTQQRSEDAHRFLRAIAIARSGRLGKKLHAVSSVGGATSGGPFPTQPVPEFLDWDFWLGQTHEADFCPNRIGWNFRWWFEYSGGQVTDWGVHHTDIAIWALGGEETGIVEARGKGNFPLGREATLAVLLGDKPFSSIPNSYNVISSYEAEMKLPNGNTIELVSRDNMLTIRGEKGTIEVNRGTLRGKPVEEIEKSPPDKEWLDKEVAKLYRGMPFNGHMGNFFHCVRTREKPISDVWTHISSVNACHMANIAMLLDRKVTFDPKKYEFAGDKEANRLMRREQRAPYTI
ncbi:MAG: Gfo/Idh/MocA family oxidoreductase [Planctomycetes bacterium]|nr:Gfo/Idh/MocA family oxidoreductase [Planctomycetota bacterium]